jgi:hypothetical protein
LRKASVFLKETKEKQKYRTQVIEIRQKKGGERRLLKKPEHVQKAK